MCPGGPTLLLSDPSAPRTLVLLQLTGLIDVRGGKVYVDPQRWSVVSADCCLLLQVLKTSPVARRLL